MNIAKLIGRKEEVLKLEKCYESKKAHLVVIYGRRRVGKTYLISQLFKTRFALKITGALNKTKEHQLENFAKELKINYKEEFITPETWNDAFVLLRNYISSKPKKEKQVIFIDEIPWLDTPKSDFLPSFEYFWNSWGAQQDNLMIIVCGSATAWMTEKFANNPGGLFNRHTFRIYLRPFTLSETEEFLKAKNIEWSRYDIAECYMTMGGIPFYLNMIDESLSYTANIDNIFFRKKGALWDEFKHLYRTLFKNSEMYLKVIEALSTKKMGMTRNEIVEKTKLPCNGDLTRTLQNLADSDFICTHNYFGKRKKDTLYQLCDQYTLFYYKFIKKNYGRDEHFWTNTIDNPARKAWAGNAFEIVCKSHIQQIKRKIGILGVLSETSIWFENTKDKDSKGAQVDLLIDRRDRVINLCEIKFSINKYAIEKDYDMQLRDKIEAFRVATKTKKAIHLTMVTTYGVKKNTYSNLVQSEVTIDDLFVPYSFQ